MSINPIAEDTNLLENNTLAFVIIFLISFLLGWFLHKFLTKCCAYSKDIDSAAPSSSTQNNISQAAAAFGYKLDDLKVIEGIGPKIEELLNRSGITTWEDLSRAEKSTLELILENAGDRFKFHNPSTWAEQAGLAAAGNFDELKEYQDFLDGGKNYKK